MNRLDMLDVPMIIVLMPIGVLQSSEFAFLLGGQLGIAVFVLLIMNS